MSTTRKRTLILVQFSMLLAIEAIVCLTPLGSLPAIGPIVATLMMIPVVITGVLLGTGAGAGMGAAAGLLSLYVWTFKPPVPPMAFIFTPFYTVGDVRGNIWSLVICLVPRIMAGIVASLVYKAMMNAFSKSTLKQAVICAVAGALGSLCNTVGVLGGIALFFGSQYEQLAGQALLAALGLTVLTNGIPEAVVCALVTMAVCPPVQWVMRRTS